MFVESRDCIKYDAANNCQNISPLEIKYNYTRHLSSNCWLNPKMTMRNTQHKQRLFDAAGSNTKPQQKPQGTRCIYPKHSQY